MRGKRLGFTLAEIRELFERTIARGQHLGNDDGRSSVSSGGSHRAPAMSGSMSGHTSTAGAAPLAGCTKYASHVPSGVLISTSPSFVSAAFATGGSIVSEPATCDLLLSTCFTVWLKAAPEEHMARVVAQGDMRPMAGNAQAMEDLRRILDGRGMLYGQADATVDTAGRSVKQSLKDLKRTIAA